MAITAVVSQVLGRNDVTVDVTSVDLGGRTPVAAIVMAMRPPSASGSFDQDYTNNQFSMGFVAATGDANASVGGAAQHNITSSNTRTSVSDGCISIPFPSDGTALRYTATLIPDGVQFTQDINSGPRDLMVIVQLIAGDDVQAFGVESNDTDGSITGIGFTPNCGIFITPNTVSAAGATPSSVRISSGCVTDTATHGVNETTTAANSLDNQNPSYNSSYGSENAFLLGIDIATGSPTFSFRHGNFAGTNGGEHVFTTSGTYSGERYHALYLRFAQDDCRTLMMNLPTTGALTNFTGYGFNPRVVFGMGAYNINVLGFPQTTSTYGLFFNAVGNDGGRSISFANEAGASPSFATCTSREDGWKFFNDRQTQATNGVANLITDGFSFQADISVITTQGRGWMLGIGNGSGSTPGGSINLKLGGTDVDAVKLGGSDVSKAYLGGTEI